MDGLIKRLNVEFDATRRNDLLKQLQEVFRKDVPITFAVSRHWSAAVNADFAGYVPTHDDDHYIVTKDTPRRAPGEGAGRLDDAPDRRPGWGRRCSPCSG